MISKIERTIAFRYLKPKKKEGFLKVISIFSFTGIALGVAILIIVMSVMNGFRTELINKILGFNPHIIVKPYNKKINKEDLKHLKELKENINIPVIGNGDIHSADDYFKMIDHTNCDAVMIGRAVIGNPWILQRRDRQEVTLPDRLDLVRKHLALNIDFYGAEKGLVLFRKHVARYIEDTPAGVRKIRVPLLTCERVSDFEELLCSLGSEIKGPIGAPV